jgi:hypothetical protein
MPDDLGLSERDKELAHWNKPYVFRPYPKMLYRGRTLSNGSLDVEQRIVANEGEEVLAAGIGWLPHPQAATDAERRRQEDLGTAAAERAWTDRHLSPAAQAEAAAIDETTAKHLGEIPERPRRQRGRPRKQTE